jgi:multidrug efflux pump subunit AcrB
MVFGHLLFGTDLTFLSIIGLVALAGIVVNNAIVLIDFANCEVAAGVDLHDALISAGTRRLRAILLTSVTTIFGLGPLILEQSFQAKFLAPMAITIAGGLASATALTLLLLPAVILIIDDLKRLMGWVREPTNALVGAEPAQEAIDHGSTT